MYGGSGWIEGNRDPVFIKVAGLCGVRDFEAVHYQTATMLIKCFKD